MVLLFCFVGAVGCTSSPDSGDGGPPVVDPDDEGIPPNFISATNVNTGYSPGAETYRVPIFTNIEGPITWTSADTAVAEIEQVGNPDFAFDLTGLTFAMITTTAPGTTTVTTTNGTISFETTIVVKEYTTENYTVGDARYNSEEAGARVACASCHQQAGGVDHSSNWLAYFDDANILSAIETAVYGDGYALQFAEHKYDLTEAEKIGIMSYLRALPPKGY